MAAAWQCCSEGAAQLHDNELLLGSTVMSAAGLRTASALSQLLDVWMSLMPCMLAAGMEANMAGPLRCSGMMIARRKRGACPYLPNGMVVSMLGGSSSAACGTGMSGLKWPARMGQAYGAAAAETGLHVDHLKVAMRYSGVYRIGVTRGVSSSCCRSRCGIQPLGFLIQLLE